MDIGFLIIIISICLVVLSVVIQKILKWFFSKDTIPTFVLWMFGIGMLLLLPGLLIANLCP